VDVYTVPELGLLTHEALDTALMLHLAHDLVDRAQAPAHLGATPETGLRIFDRIVDHLATTLETA
jgi:hypothetical protein